METISQETRMISEKEFQHVAEDAQVLGLETREEIKNRIPETIRIRTFLCRDSLKCSLFFISWMTT